MIEAVYQSYLWTGSPVITKRALVAREKICLPKGARGLDVIKMNVWNQAALCKFCAH